VEHARVVPGLGILGQDRLGEPHRASELRRAIQCAIYKPEAPAQEPGSSPLSGVPPAVPPDHRHRVPFRAELPRSPVGRVLERELRAERPTAITWDAEASGIAYDKR
jgi:hypothetical protein